MSRFEFSRTMSLNDLPVELDRFQPILQQVHEIGVQMIPSAQRIEQLGENVCVPLIQFLCEVKRNQVALDALTTALRGVKGGKQINKLIRWSLSGVLGQHYDTLKGLIEKITSVVTLWEHQNGQVIDQNPTAETILLFIRSRVYGTHTGLTACHYEWRAIQEGLARIKREPTEAEKEKQQRFARFELEEQRIADEAEAKVLNITVEQLHQQKAQTELAAFKETVANAERAIKQTIGMAGTPVPLNLPGLVDGFYIYTNGQLIKVTARNETEMLACMVANAMKKLD